MTLSTSSFRLRPGEDLRTGIEAACAARGLGAAAIVTCVGSLASARLRLANASEIADLPGPFEIVSLVGTVARNGVHLHAALADANGGVVGGHVAMGCIVHTTAEVVLLDDKSLVFDRRFDPETGYRELTIERRSTP